jgi:hypothetical protein
VDPEPFARNKLRPQLRELPLGEVRVLIEEVLGEDELEDRIAEEFEALIVEVMPLRLVAQARVSESLSQEQGIAEFVAKTLFERIHQGGRSGVINTGSPPTDTGIPCHV